MRRFVDRKERRTSWLILAAAWILLLYPFVFVPTAQSRGGHVLVFAGMSISFVLKFWRWGLRSLELNEWLYLPTAVALGLTLNIGTGRGGMVLNYAALTMLVMPFLRYFLARRR